MMLKRWEDLPDALRLPAVKPYYDRLHRQRAALLIKRAFDFIASLVLLMLISPVLLALALWIRSDSEGPVFFKQRRVTQYGRVFEIFKFRTMADGADRRGAQVTQRGDPRITRVGHALRRRRLDELPQLINILKGDMSFVGTRPEVERFVDVYTDEMMATLLLPAGVTSRASLLYKDEDELMAGADDPEAVYIKRVLPEKMRYNLEAIEQFSLITELKTLIKTLGAMLFG